MITINRIKRKIYVALQSFKKYKKNNRHYSFRISPWDDLRIDNITEYDDSLFTYSGNILRIKKRDFERPFSQIKVKGNRELIGIESWDSNKIILKKVKSANFRPLLREENLSVFWKDNALYSQTEKGVNRLCNYVLDDFLYCDMIHSGEWYALRSGGCIKISRDLKNWQEIYNGKRGIRQSMVFIGEDSNLQLLFIEYSPGRVHYRHSVLCYSISTNEIKPIETFYTKEEHINNGLSPFARHIHTISKDPYTGDVYVGTGDSDDESGIYVLKNGEKHFSTFLKGSQNYRTLSFIFSEDSIFWNTDTHEPQFLYRCNRVTKIIDRFAMVNGALWCTELYPHKINGSNFYIMSSNSEGALYDNYNRVYGIEISNGEEPHIYELLKTRSRIQYSQQFIMGVDFNDNIILFDHEIDKVRAYKLALL